MPGLADADAEAKVGAHKCTDVDLLHALSKIQGKRKKIDCKVVFSRISMGSKVAGKWRTLAVPELCAIFLFPIFLLFLLLANPSRFGIFLHQASKAKSDGQALTAFSPLHNRWHV